MLRSKKDSFTMLVPHGSIPLLLFATTVFVIGIISRQALGADGWSTPHFEGTLPTGWRAATDSAARQSLRTFSKGQEAQGAQTSRLIAYRGKKGNLVIFYELEVPSGFSAKSYLDKVLTVGRQNFEVGKQRGLVSEVFQHNLTKNGEFFDLTSDYTGGKSHDYIVQVSRIHERINDVVFNIHSFGKESMHDVAREEIKTFLRNLSMANYQSRGE